MTNDKHTYEVRDMTNSRVIGEVQSVSEYGARRAGAKLGNIPHAHVAVSLVPLTVSEVYAHSVETVTPEPDAYDRPNSRKRGAYVALLDGDKVRAFLESAGWDYPGQLGLILSSDGERAAIIGTEGVGMTTNNDGSPVRYYGLAGFMWTETDMHVGDICHAFTGKRMDVADFVRTFGSRLDVNAAQWTRFALGDAR